MKSAPDRDWWKTLFDEVYLLTDARSVCDEEITKREVDAVRGLLSPQPDDKILDLCGGHGRHSLELARRGFIDCTVVDYSRPLLDRGRAQAADEGLPVTCHQADARRTGLKPASFDQVLIMGNSLGYLPDASGDREILEEAYRLLRPGGGILIDVTDGRVVKSRLNPNAWHEIGEDIVVCRERELQGDVTRTREMVVSKKDGLIRDRTYAIRLFNPERLTALLKEAGFDEIKVSAGFSNHRKKGDYGFMKHRLLVSARRPARKQ